MSKNTPVRKATADLLSWPEYSAGDSPPHARSSARSHQPSDGISKVVFGGQVTDEEVESLNKRKPVSGYKLKEITGSGIFAARGENDVEESDAANPTPNSKTGLRMYQQTVSGISHISFGEEESVSPKKALSEAKQRELSGTLDNESDAKLKKQFSTAKNKELSGTDIFAPPPEIKPRPLGARALALRETISIGESPHTNGEEPVKTAKKIPSQKFTELSGNNIFKGDEPPPSSEKSLSSAKLREMSGSNIFADGKAESRDYLGGVRKPPGGESSIALV
uniref:DNA oxidative demethylase n=1 Tax=Tanacetum cinerariifolium TaxID=118510 RepID=A0A6L2NIL3_TANCI|nr:DNA oxidative demethylase [Tanacetum cinerariifolium]